MTGDNAGNFLIFESESGKLLHQANTGGAVAGGVITYMRNGKQYVALTSGNVSPASFGSVGRPSVVILSLPGSAAAPATAVPPDAARGKQLYVQLCAGCHGPDGDRIAGKELKSVKSRLDATQLGTFIVSPTGTMPKIFPDPRTSDDERDIRDVAAYVTQWQ
jgi:mono/diheme cytochrome c family protein